LLRIDNQFLSVEETKECRSLRLTTIKKWRIL
jgi:hypothetical protein